MAGKRLSANQWKWVAARYREGYTERVLAEFLGVCRYTVARHLQEMGVIPERIEDVNLLEEQRGEFEKIGGK